MPNRFKEVMENSLLYPEGWKYWEFVGIFRNPAINNKKIRVTDNGIVDQVMSEANQQSPQGRDQQLLILQQQVAQLIQSQGTGGGGQLRGGQVCDEQVGGGQVDSQLEPVEKRSNGILNNKQFRGNGYSHFYVLQPYRN